MDERSNADAHERPLRRPFAWSIGPASVNAERRRSYQFRLRTLMVAIVLLSIPLAYLGSQIRTVRHRKTVLDLVASCGGSYFIGDGDLGGGLRGGKSVGPFSKQTRELGPAVDIRPGNRAEIPSGFRR
jgi:hypothetical protein